MGFPYDEINIFNIDEFDGVNFLHMYPNPTNNSLFINISFNENQESIISLFDVLGNQVSRKTYNTKELKTKIDLFHDEELEHRDIAVDYKGREARHYKLLHDVIQTGCRTAIKIAEKI